MTDEARVFRCGDCGGPNFEATRNCRFCAAPIATLRCADCYHMNLAENRNCSACGEVLGLVPLTAPSEVRCPACDLECDALEGDPGRLFDCSRCGGQFVEPVLLHELLERRKKIVRPAPAPTILTLDCEVRYWPCPICDQMMQRRNFGGNSGIVVDVCREHGTWFEHGELTRVLSFVEGGGLVDVRRHQLGLPQPKNRAEQVRVAQAIASAMARNQARAKLPNRTFGDGAAADEKADAAQSFRVSTVALGVLESTLELLASIGEFVGGPTS